MHYVVGLLYEGFSSAARARQGLSEVLCQILGDLAGLGVNAGIKAILGAVGFVGDHHDVTTAGGHGEGSSSSPFLVGQVELLDSREHTTPPEAT